MFLDLSAKKILVIDDMPNFRSAIRNMLTPYGAVNIHVAPDGETAIPLVEKNRYDIILCDYNLGPGKKDGQQVLEELKGRGLISFSTIFMMLTAESTSDMVMGAIEYAPDDYLVKPLTEEMVGKRLTRMIVAKKELEPIEIAMRNKEFQRARDLCDEMMKSNPKYLFDLLKIKSDICLESGDYHGAEKVYQDILEKRNISWAKLGLGMIAFHQRDYEKAKHYFEEVVSENINYIPAYDWLAKTIEKMGDAEGAKQILADATEISPKYIPRQRSLGDVSYKTGDMDSAEKSYKKAVELGQNSYLKNPSDYTHLAKVLVDKGSGQEALRVAKDVRMEFKDNKEALLQSYLSEGMALKSLDRSEEASKMIKRAADTFDKIEENVPAEVAIDLAKSCIEMGDKERGLGLVSNFAGNYHDDEEVLGQIRNLFEETNLVQEGEAIISSSINEVNRINNEGIRLLEQKEYIQAIDYFKEAANKLPGNRILTANVAHAAILYMKQNGKSREMVQITNHYLERTAQIDPNYQRYHRLLEMNEEIVG